ncbi:DNA-3-methyladenine glycosylase I [Neokomagataea thailandica NBRC 106555]|uniref:DNA-3-methyladenine glycosylase I n=2 Tax=Neokomagataea TaxID=1223423 RepID=A0A4Y6V5E8_9PROT|nr:MULTISPECIES: DNA-3-methyladenine glycosylase I [Neokomagataea]QDH24098.1 DNA-3-methyladenine glycosylase I [Neokomagataea tanensis]GBR50378.1 DNA-3-methyladenine glycosylase I [Neokomagataea thailandica NBRC 106555]
MEQNKQRCKWAEATPLLKDYHDTEWGKPAPDERSLWETLMLESFQAGLSWRIVLERREALRAAFAQFEPHKVALFTPQDVERLMLNADIIRSKAKIEAVIHNARIFMDMQSHGESLEQLLAPFTQNAPFVQSVDEQPQTQSPLSCTIAHALKKRGFKFIGPVIIYAWLQAIGIVDDHEPQCFNHFSKRH